MFSLIKTTLSNHLEKFAIFNRQNPTLRTFFPNALDEVDEANIERLIDMLKTSFRLDQLCDCDSLKQTMTAGKTLYGITMQESGISKRASAPYEDISEDYYSREFIGNGWCGSSF